MATTKALPKTLPMLISTSKITCMYTSTSLLNGVVIEVDSVAFSWVSSVDLIILQTFLAQFHCAVVFHRTP